MLLFPSSARLGSCQEVTRRSAAFLSRPKTYVYIYIHTHVCMYVYIYIYIYIYAYIYIYIHTHTYTYTYVYTYSFICCKLFQSILHINWLRGEDAGSSKIINNYDFDNNIVVYYISTTSYRYYII